MAQNNAIVIDCIDSMLIRINSHLSAYYKDAGLFESDPDYSQKQLWRAIEGKKYVKCVAGGSVLAFIDKETGDIFKPASWSTPATEVCAGNVKSERNGDEAINYSYGAHVFVSYRNH